MIITVFLGLHSQTLHEHFTKLKRDFRVVDGDFYVSYHLPYKSIDESPKYMT